MTVKGVLMAGGKGTRLRPITYSIPKPLVPVAGKPCIEYPLNSFNDADIKDIIITTGYKYEYLISGLLKNERNKQNILFSVEREPAGTAGSVKLVHGFLDDTFVVGSGDILFDFDIKAAIKNHEKSGKAATIVLTEVEDPSQLGIVESTDGIVKRFLEKPSASEVFSNKANTGIYILEPEILEHIPENETYDFGKQLFPKLLSEGVEINSWEGKGVWLDTGRPKELIAGSQIMASRYGFEIKEKNINGSIIMKERPIGDSYKINGNCYLGENVKIGKETSVHNSMIYNGVEIGDNVKISDSIIFNGCRIDNETELSGSVIMENTSIGKKCIINRSALSSNLNIQNSSRIYDVSLSSNSSE